MFNDNNSFSFICLSKNSYSFKLMSTGIVLLSGFIKLYLFFMFIVFVFFRNSFFIPVISFLYRLDLESEQNLFSVADMSILMGVYFIYLLNFGSTFIALGTSNLFFFKTLKFTIMIFSSVIIFLPTYFL